MCDAQTGINVIHQRSIQRMQRGGAIIFMMDGMMLAAPPVFVIFPPVRCRLMQIPTWKGFLDLVSMIQLVVVFSHPLGLISSFPPPPPSTITKTPLLQLYIAKRTAGAYIDCGGTVTDAGQHAGRSGPPRTKFWKEEKSSPSSQFQFSRAVCFSKGLLEQYEDVSWSCYIWPPMAMCSPADDDQSKAEGFRPSHKHFARPATVNTSW